MTEKHHRNGKNEKITATALTNRTLILFKYFWETTDEAHPISLTDISAHLKEHGITADPRTLRSDIEQLVEFGVDIVKERRVQNLYHVATRHFEAPEVKLLIDAVQSARFITPGKSKDSGGGSSRTGAEAILRCRLCPPFRRGQRQTRRGYHRGAEKSPAPVHRR